MFKMTGSQLLESTTENDRMFEFEKMRSDITTFRKELEAENELVHSSTLGISETFKEKI
jgi:hypothetical protein